MILLFRQFRCTKKRELGDDHPAALETKHGLAELYKEQARHEEAEKYLLEAIEGRHLKLGDTHSDTLESLNNLITPYDPWKKPEEAVQWRAKLTEIEGYEK